MKEVKLFNTGMKNSPNLDFVDAVKIFFWAPFIRFVNSNRTAEAEITVLMSHKMARNLGSCTQMVVCQNWFEGTAGFKQIYFSYVLS